MHSQTLVTEKTPRSLSSEVKSLLALETRKLTEMTEVRNGEDTGLLDKSDEMLVAVNDTMT